MHCLAYRRLKHKTQVFFNTQNDHICTRMEHVNHVESVSYTIASYLGLNTELTKAISVGHDLGHPPFGHEGERILNDISKKYLKKEFWHEKNGLHFVDNIELLEDTKRRLTNLGLTYAVRDGIISHCGEVSENSVFPRDDYIDLYTFQSPNDFRPYTWEGCVVKIADKIAYIGRDLEDAAQLRFIRRPELRELTKLARNYGFESLNTTLFMHEIIKDLCNNSTPKQGLNISPKNIELIDLLGHYNNEYIYRNDRFTPYKAYVELVLTTIFEVLYNIYHNGDTLLHVYDLRNNYHELARDFYSWLGLYTNLISSNIEPKNRIIYGSLETIEEYTRAIIDYISGMTDQYAVKIFTEITRF